MSSPPAGDAAVNELPGLRQTIHPANPVLSKVVIETYEGERDERGRYVGVGRATFKFGHTYEGQFADGWMHGEGVFRWADGTVFQGTFVRNTIEGRGRYDWPDGSYYEGEVQGGIRHGEGCMQVASRRRPRSEEDRRFALQNGFSKQGQDDEEEGDDEGDRILGPFYEGSWRRGKRHGEGTLWYEGKGSDAFYKGSWVNGLREGPQGVMRYPSGNVYTGSWKADRRHGSGGVMRWTNMEEVYEGDWRDGLQHGIGTHVWLAGGRAEHGATQRLMCNRYVGEWMAGLRHGTGTFYYSNGSRYMGGFQRNQKHGHGVYQFPDGRVYEGPFTEDRMGFNDGSLEEKVPTRGPVKVVSSRKGSGKSKKKKRKASPTASLRAVPLAGTTRNVHLNIGDLMVGLGPKERGAGRRGIEKLVMRWNSGMKTIYAHYSQLNVTDGGVVRPGKKVGGSADRQEDSFYLNQAQFRLLARDCGLVSQRFPLAALARVFSTVKIQFAQSIALARRRREATERGVDEDQTPSVDDRLYMETDDAVHSAQRPILYRGSLPFFPCFFMFPRFFSYIPL